MLIAGGRGAEAGLKGVGDAGAHFGGGGFGEGEDEEVLDAGVGGAGGGGAADEAGAAFGEDGSFAGAGGGGDDEVAMHMLDGGELGGGPVRRGEGWSFFVHFGVMLSGRIGLFKGDVTGMDIGEEDAVVLFQII